MAVSATVRYRIGRDSIAPWPRSAHHRVLRLMPDTGHSPAWIVRFSNMSRASGPAMTVRGGGGMPDMKAGSAETGSKRSSRLPIAARRCSRCSAVAGARPGRIRPPGWRFRQLFRCAPAIPALCAARCERDQRCRAWAFSYPATESTNAVCWLKSRVTPRITAPCCASGVRGTGVIEPRGGRIEFGMDRFGGDYRQLEVATEPTGRRCQLGLRGRRELPGLDLCAPRLRRVLGGLLPQEPHHPPGAQAVLHFRGGALADRGTSRSLPPQDRSYVRGGGHVMAAGNNRRLP